MEEYGKLLEQMKKNHVSNISRYQLIRTFNTRFYNPDHYRTHPPTPWMTEVEENRTKMDYITDSVLTVCINTEICKLFNTSFNEIYSTWDLAFFNYAKDLVNQNAEMKQKIINDAARKTKEAETKRMLEIKERKQ